MKMSSDTRSATFLVESEAGRSHSKSPSGQLMLQFGQDLAHVSHSALPANEREFTTTDICGRSSCASSMSADLQRCLENKLRARMDGIGSPLYVLTWKHWDMRSGPPICALRASVPRTSDSGCFGWPTATSTDAIKGGKVSPRKNMMGLTETVHQAGWPTPDSSYHGQLTQDKAMQRIESHKNGGPKRSANLEDVVSIASGWATPKASDGSKGGPNQTGGTLPQQVSGWGTPTANDKVRSGTFQTGRALTPREAIGLTLTTSPAETERPGQLNPEFVCWLMGFPAVWLNCVDWGTQSCRKSRQNS